MAIRNFWTSLLKSIPGNLSLLHNGAFSSRNRPKRFATEVLEDRTLLAAITVTTADDVVDANDGLISLREAIATAESNGVSDSIVIQGGLFFVTVDQGELIIDSPIEIDGNGATISAVANSRLFSLFSNAVVTMSNVALSDGTGVSSSGNSGEGGAIRNEGGSLTLDGVNLSSNLTSGTGGAIWNSGTLTIVNSFLSLNRALGTGIGGAVYQGNDAANTRILNSTLAFNTAQVGAGVANEVGQLSIVNSTIVSNTALVKGGGLFANQNVNTTTALNNTIVAGNEDSVLTTQAPNDLFITTDGTNNNGAINVSNSNANIIGDANSSGGLTDGSQSNIVGNGGSGVLPLGAILDTQNAPNGTAGVTFTFALFDGSIAIDAGLNSRAKDPGLDGVFSNGDDGPTLVNDQRGIPFARIVDSGAANVDIGAFEFAYPTELVVSASLDVEDGNYAPGSFSLREAIALANDRPGPDTITFDLSTEEFAAAIFLNGDHLEVTDELDIIGPGHSLRINAFNNSRIFAASAPLTLRGLELSNGNGSKGSHPSSLFDGFEGVGGAIVATDLLTLIGTTIYGSTSTQGGGIYVQSGTSATFINTTISGNSATNAGGGVRLTAGTSGAFVNSTVTGNRSDSTEVSSALGGGIGIDGGATALINNTIIAGNFTGGGTTANDISGSVTGFNSLIGDASSAGGLTDGANGNLVGNNGPGVRDISTVLDTTLQNNGGPVRTHALLPTSVAINAGDDSLAKDEINNPLGSDARGNPFVRFGGGGGSGLTTVDIGAYEVQPQFVVNTIQDETTSDNTFSLREAIAAANAQDIGGSLAGVADVITLVPGLSGTMFLTGGELEISSDLFIIGSGANNLTINAGGTSRHFVVNSFSVEISGLTLTGGNASTGGAILNFGQLTLRQVHLTGNTAEDSGAIDSGGISNDQSISLTLVDSTVSQNVASVGSGGGIFNGQNLTIINSTISGNSAAEVGGGIVNVDVVGRINQITNSTITGNRAGAGGEGLFDGGGIYILAGTIQLNNTIVAGNFFDTVNSPNDITLGPPSSFGFIAEDSSNNLIGDADTAGNLINGKNGNIVGVNGTGTRNINTILDTALADNGGPTLTHALVTGSPAIDAGNLVKAVDENGATLLVDQRGFRRVLDGDGDGNFRVDIGAVEAPAQEVTGGLVFDQSNGSFRLATVVSETTVNWFQSGSLGSFQQGFIGDFDGDGLLDGMTLNPNNLRFNFFKNNGDGTLANPVSAGTLSSDYTWGNFMVGDFDGDGREEVMGQILSGPVGVGSMRSQSFNGTSQFYIRLATGYEGFVAGDFNGDGIDDILGLFDNVDETRSNIIPIISINTPVGRRMTAILGSGQFGQSVATGGLHNLVASDFNGDGRDDIAVLNSVGQTLTASSTGTPRVNAPDARNFIVSNTSPKFLPASYPNSIMTGNFDNDILADLFTIHDAGHLVTTSSTLTSNNLPVQTAAVDGSQSSSDLAIIGDFDGNGLDDVVVLGTNAVVFFSNGTTFNPGQDFGAILGGPIGQIGASRTGRVL